MFCADRKATVARIASYFNASMQKNISECNTYQGRVKQATAAEDHTECQSCEETQDLVYLDSPKQDNRTWEMLFVLISFYFCSSILDDTGKYGANNHIFVSAFQNDGTGDVGNIKVINLCTMSVPL